MKDLALQHIDTQELFAKIVADTSKPTLVIFLTSWSGSAIILKKIILALMETYHNQVQFYEVDIEINAASADTWNIRTIPTILIFKQGELIDLFTGLISANQIREKLNRL